jgi:hypothetical protein
LNKIKINNWNEFQPRKDVKKASWFRLEHSLFEHPKFYILTQVELLFWVYLLTCASKENSDTFVFSEEHASRFGRFDESVIKSAISKLTNLEMIENVTSTSRARNVKDRKREIGDTSLPATLHNITLHNITLHNKTTTTNSKTEIEKPAQEISLQENINHCWQSWNETLKEFGLNNKNISPSDERTLAQAIKTLGIDRVKNSLVGKRFEIKSQNYDPKNTLSLEYCLSRNKSGQSNHERLENLALQALASQEKILLEENHEHIARFGRGDLND